MDFMLTIRLGNDAMQNPDDLADALEEVIAKLNDRGFTPDRYTIIRDSYGNTVGQWGVITDRDTTRKDTNHG